MGPPKDHIHASEEETPLQPNEGNRQQPEPTLRAVKPQSGQRTLSSRKLARFALNVGIAAIPLFFVVFAIFAYRQDGTALELEENQNLLAIAQYGPTIFPIVFAAIIGRFLQSIAATLLELGTTVGTIECLLGGRTVSSAATLPLSLRFAHPVMFMLFGVWALSPLGGQAALRVVGPASVMTNSTSTISYLDLSTSVFQVYGGSSQGEFGNIILSAFNAALSSPGASKSSSQDLFGNLKVPLIEANHDVEGPDDEGWFDVRDSDSTTYSSLAGLPVIGVPAVGETLFSVESSYMYPNCSVDVVLNDEGPSRQREGTPAHAILWNGWYLSFQLDNLHNASSTRPLVTRMRSYTLDMSPEATSMWILTDASCTITTTYVETQFSCKGTNCSPQAIRYSTLPHFSANLTALDGIFWTNATLDGADPFTQSRFFALLVNATTQSSVNIHTNYPSPLEYYFLNPASPYSWDISSYTYVIGLIGDVLFSQRFGQLLNTLWLDGVAPFAVTGNFTQRSYPEFGVRSLDGKVSQTQILLRCHPRWLAILFLTSLAMILAGIVAAVLDIYRRGPDVLGGFSLALRENNYVRAPMESSMEDERDMARRLRRVKVHIGDVKPEADIGHVAIATTSPDQPALRLRSTRFYQ
ncbi:hypothetical protein LTR37_011083 [Vermiconidia calcicola]|uniref:Uncharacterized protein n=1 Tax=Vermiconidia calcicola TaxID=1690605 RepID=A0ACC3N5Z8_9PEZI|nr:hypothetical protein LTR37_011083 [Vermiconidia calcicola]